MHKTNQHNSFFFFVLSGFGIGLSFFLLYYWSVFNVIQGPFRIDKFINIHSATPVSWFFDLLPFLGILMAVFCYRYLKDISRKHNTELISHQNQNQVVISAVRNIARGDLSGDLSGDDELTKSLHQLQNSIRENILTEEKRQEENRKRSRISEGMAKFGGILREYSDNMESLSYKLISELVKYLGANQGGFFVTEKNERDEKYLNMLACYAYDRKKFANKKIPWKEGVIGNTAMEMKTLYISELPENYLEITSGLGKSTPRYLLLTPLIHNDDVKGILEIASFREIKNYEIEFVEQVAEIIAMTLENILNSRRTEQLLQETRTQAEKLIVQEEKVRRNMNELKEIQEQAAKQAEKFISFSTTVNHTLIRAEYDVNGILLYANTKFIRKLGYSGNREVEGKHISLFIDEKDREWFDNYWESLAHGGAHFEGYMKHVAKNGQDLWTMATYTCMRREDSSVEKVLFLAIDTTVQKVQSLKFESQIEALDKLNVKAEFSPDGKLINFNKLFINTFKYPTNELGDKTVYDFLDRKDIENFSDNWENMIRGHAIQSQIRMVTKSQEEKWFRASFTSVNDMYGEVTSVIFLANEITNEKIMENEGRLQTESLKKQEEKFRLENLSLNRELQEMKEKMIKENRHYELMLSLFTKLLEYKEGMNFIFDNRGEIIYINKPALAFFGLEQKTLPETTTQLLSLIPTHQHSDFFDKLLDPAKPKNFSAKTLSLKDNKGNEKTYRFNFRSKEAEDRRIYTASLVIK